MLEILLLIKLCGSIGRTVQQKGHRKVGYQFLLIVLWFGGEFLGAIIGSIIEMVLTESEEAGFLLPYLFALGGAALGAVTAFQIAKRLPPLHDEADFPLDDEYAQRWRTRKVLVEDTPDAPPAGAEGITDAPLPTNRRQDDRIQEGPETHG